jgi:purine-binding chemotaxis protein CheW
VIEPPDPPAVPVDARREAILRERARELAQAREEDNTEVLPLLPFEVGGERYALEALCVQQILDARRVDPLFGAPRGVIGAIIGRTRPIPVLDLRHLLGLQGGGLSDLQRVVVVEDAGDLFGLAVEHVSPRLDVPVADLRPADSGPFRWIGPDRLAVLDPSRLGVATRDGS